MSDPERLLAAKGRRDRLEAALFAAPDGLASTDCAQFLAPDESVEDAIERINAELERRPYAIVRSGGRYRFQTRPGVLPPPAIPTAPALSARQSLLLTAIAYFQPITLARACEMLGAAPSRDALNALVRAGYVARGLVAPEPGAPRAYVTTERFLAAFGLDSLADLPDMELLRDNALDGPNVDIAEVGRVLRHPDYSDAADDEPLDSDFRNPFPLR